MAIVYEANWLCMYLDPFLTSLAWLFHLWYWVSVITNIWFVMTPLQVPRKMAEKGPTPGTPTEDAADSACDSVSHILSLPFKWLGDVKRKNISENSDNKKYKWINDRMMKWPNAPWEGRGVPLQRQDPKNF